jgi:hypothetical protein
MVLDQEDAGKPQLLGRDDVFDEILIAVAVAGGAAARARRRTIRISSRRAPPSGPGAM